VTDALHRLRAAPSPRLRLVCIPYAGGAPSAFRGWLELLPPEIDLWAAQPPGHGARVDSPPLECLEPMVDELAGALTAEPATPTAIFGHSMGALLGFELARELRRRGHPPQWLFASGHRAPQLETTDPPAHELDDAGFLARLRELGGTPEEALEHPELMDVFLPILRADFAAVETYAYRPEAPLACGITAFGGDGDERVSRRELEAWRAQTVGRFAAHSLPGGHFFLRQSAPRLVSVVVRDVLAA
jgi:medium-chain acyl-[acyl-carrier-protein] hydrolase